MNTTEQAKRTHARKWTYGAWKNVVKSFHTVTLQLNWHESKDSNLLEHVNQS